MRLFQQTEIQVEKGPRATFPPAVYLYFGSAFGSGGLRARIARHLALAKKIHWHIDRFLQVGVVRSLYFSTVPQRLECVWVNAFSGCCDFSAPVARFGASDCRSACPAHLLRCTEETDLNPWFASLRSPLPGKERGVWLQDI